MEGSEESKSVKECQMKVRKEAWNRQGQKTERKFKKGCEKANITLMNGRRFIAWFWL